VQGVRSIRADDLDSARFAVGTDEDLLIIEVPEQAAESAEGAAAARAAARAGVDGPWPLVDDAADPYLRFEPRPRRWDSDDDGGDDQGGFRASEVALAAASRIRRHADSLWSSVRDSVLASLMTGGSRDELKAL
jgi:hypothetical protein